MSESPTYSRDGIARTAKQMRESAAKRGKRPTQQDAGRRVRQAIRKTPEQRD